MVTIKFYPDPCIPAFTIEQYDSVMVYLQETNRTKDELLDLRFFRDELLSEEIPTSTPDFLDIDEGIVAITLDSMIPRDATTWIYIGIAIISAIASVVLSPKISIPAVVGHDQKSATNKLGSSTNEPRINERIDDLFGRVTNHTPPLWQVPYRVGINNQEHEVLFLCVGRGKYNIDMGEIKDGNATYASIPNSQVEIYEPHTHPFNGSPSQTLGAPINRQIGIYSEADDLNPAELVPPNEKVIGDAIWNVDSTEPATDNVYLTLTNATELGVTLSDYFSAGQDVSLTNTYIRSAGGTQSLWNLGGEHVFPTFTPLNVAGSYPITNVLGNVLTITAATWVSFLGQFLTTYFDVAQEGGSRLFFTYDTAITSNDWHTGPTNNDPETTYVTLNESPDVGSVFGNTIGPINTPDDAESILVNLTSSNGFYKLIDGDVWTINDAIVEIVIHELHSVTRLPTGFKTTIPIYYQTNGNSHTASVFRTIPLTLPYSYNSVSCTRTTDRDKASNVSNVDRIEWSAMYSYEPLTGAIDLGDVTTMHCVIPSNSQSRLVKERRTNLSLTRLITEYLGGGSFGAAESYATDNALQILTHVTLDPYIGRLTVDDANFDGFLALSDQILAYFASDQMVRFGYDFDTTQLTFQDTFILICNAVNCLPYVQLGIYDAFFERQQSVSATQITCRNKIEGSESREQIFKRQYDGVEVTYRDEITGVTETVYLPSDKSALNPDRTELLGVVTIEQASCYAYRMFNKQIHARWKITFDVDEFGRNIIPAQRIDSPDSTRFSLREGATDGYRIYDGEVVEAVGLTVELSEPVVFTVAEDHYIVFTSENGDNSTAILCTEVADTDGYVVLLNAFPSESIYDGYSKDKTKFTFMSEQLRESIALIPQTIEFSISADGAEVNTIGSINYTDSYYTNDLI
jgi:hypothetical protein